MTNSTHTATQNASTAGSKARRITASMFFKKSPKQEKSSSKDETIQRLQDENRKLQQELEDADSRIRKYVCELELATAATAAANQPPQSELSLSPTSNSMPSTSTSATEFIHTLECVEYRDDDGGGEDPDDYSDNCSVEVKAATVEYAMERELLDDEDETQSTTSSACTIPTGNDIKSKFHRRQQQLRQRLRRSSSSSSSSSHRRGEDAYLNYFSRRSPSLESITEINRRRSLMDGCDSWDDIPSSTIDLTPSLACSTMGDDQSTDGSSLMSGRMLPLYAMKSLLRISSTESDRIPYVVDEESSLFGEI